MKRPGTMRQRPGAISRPMNMVKLSRLSRELKDLQSSELVTPCRLLIVLIVSIALIMLIAVSISGGEMYAYDMDMPSLEINMTQRPYQLNYECVQEQREEMLKDYGYSPPHMKVEKRSALSLQEFWDLYDGKWPVIIQDIVPNWEAYKKWSKQFFLQRYGSHKVTLKAVQGFLEEGVAHFRDMKTFISLLEQETGPNTWTYMEDELFLLDRQELKADIGDNFIMDENFFHLFPKEIRPWDMMMLWGTKHSRSTLHLDPYNWTAISAVIWGRKLWKLYPPGQDHNLYIQPKLKCGFPLECKKYNSKVDAYDADYLHYPRFRKAEYMEVEQNSGEMLVIPSGWFHQAFNAEETLSLSTQLMNRNNYLVVLEEIIKGRNLNRRKLPAHFHTLLPPDQVKLFISLLPKRVLDHGRELMESLNGSFLTDEKNYMSDLQYSSIEQD